MMTHAMNCPGLNPMSENFCTCGLQYRIALETKQTMRTAWRKRAEEAEKDLADCTASHQRTNTKLAEAEKDSELLDWLIDRLNSAEDTDDLWDMCAGTSDDVHEEFRAAICAARGKKQ